VGFDCNGDDDEKADQIELYEMSRGTTVTHLSELFTQKDHDRSVLHPLGIQQDIRPLLLTLNCLTFFNSPHPVLLLSLWPPLDPAWLDDVGEKTVEASERTRYG
jgi:hypothetical protein